MVTLTFWQCFAVVFVVTINRPKTELIEDLASALLGGCFLRTFFRASM